MKGRHNNSTIMNTLRNVVRPGGREAVYTVSHNDYVCRKEFERTNRNAVY